MTDLPGIYPPEHMLDEVAEHRISTPHGEIVVEWDGTRWGEFVSPDLARRGGWTYIGPVKAALSEKQGTLL